MCGSRVTLSTSSESGDEVNTGQVCGLIDEMRIAAIAIRTCHMTKEMPTCISNTIILRRSFCTSTIFCGSLSLLLLTGQSALQYSITYGV